MTAGGVGVLFLYAGGCATILTFNAGTLAAIYSEWCKHRRGSALFGLGLLLGFDLFIAGIAILVVGVPS